MDQEIVTTLRLNSLRQWTEQIDSCRQGIQRMTNVAAAEIIKRIPGVATDERWLSVKGDIVYFRLLSYLNGYTDPIDFELPSELAVSDDVTAINKWMDEDAETQQLLQEIAQVHAPFGNKCNRHDDCKAADEAAKQRGAFAAEHCHDDCCDECFGN